MNQPELAGRWKYLPCAVLLALTVIFFSPFLFQGKVFLAADNLNVFCPWNLDVSRDFQPENYLLRDPLLLYHAPHYNEALKNGEVHLWNPYVLTGNPSPHGASTGAPGRFYPPKMLLHLLLPTHYAQTMLLFVHVLMMGCFMYVYLADIGAGWRGSLFGSVAYMFNGCGMVWLEFESWTTAFALLPLLLYFMERHLSDKRYMFAFYSGLVLGLIALTGNVQLLIYIVVLMALYLAFLLVRAWTEKSFKENAVHLVSCSAITSVTGALIGAVDLMPLHEMIEHSSRIGREFDFNSLFSTLARVPYRFFVTLLIPDFFGSPAMGFDMLPVLPTQEYGNYNELALYAGVATVFVFIAGVAGIKDSWSWFYISLTLLFASMAAGSVTYYPFYKLVPGMDRMNPTRLVFLFSFSMAVCAGLGIRAVGQASKSRAKVMAGIVCMLLALVFLLGITGSSPHIIEFFNSERFSGSDPAADQNLQIISNLRSMDSSIIYKPLVIGLITLIAFMAILFVKGRKLSIGAYSVLVLVLAYDLMSFGLNYNPFSKPSDIFRKTQGIDYLMKQGGIFRVAQDKGSGLHPNTLVPFGIQEVGGYASFYPDRVNKLMSYVRFGDNAFYVRGLGRWVVFYDFSSKLFDLMNVKYVLTSPERHLSYPGMVEVFRGDIAIYENRDVMARAFAVHRHVRKHDYIQVLRYMGSDDSDMSSEVVLEEEPSERFMKGNFTATSPPRVSIVSYEPDRISVTADLSADGWLVLTDSHFPGWRASIDGLDAKIYLADGNFRAVELQAGRHEVVFSYEPDSVRKGFRLTMVGVAVCVIGIAVLGRRRSKKAGLAQ